MTDAWGSVPSASVGTALGRAWAARGARVAVVPLGAVDVPPTGAGDGVGTGFARAWADLHHGEAQVVRVGGFDVLTERDGSRLLVRPSLGAPDETRWETDSSVLAQVLDQVVGDGVDHVVLELDEVPWRDGGRGFVSSWRAGRAWPRGVRVDLATSADRARAALTGLRGVVSLEGRGQGMDPARMLQLDQDLCDWAEEFTGDPRAGEQPGSGAAGGVGLTVLARGGVVTTGPGLLMADADVERTLAGADLVVTGCPELNFGTMGGEVVADVTAAAAEHGVPVLAVVGRNWISARELRQMGLEAAQPLLDEVGGHDGGPAEETPWQADPTWLTRAVEPVVRTWSW